MTGDGVGQGGADDAAAAHPRLTPTTAAQRWTEVIEISHEGLAVLDADGRFEFVSDRTAAALEATADELLGREFDGVVHGLAAAELAMIESSRATGEPVRLMSTRRGADGWIRALRLTFVPRDGDGEAAGGMIMLSHDITPLRFVQDQRRRAQHRLTAVEDEEQRRIRSEVHDGPIQILAALALRLGMTVTEEASQADLHDLEHAVESASRELREILTVPTLSSDDSPANLLHQWAEPLIDGSTLRLEIEDRSTHPPNRATTEALFVFLHETIKESLLSPVPQTIDALVTDEPGGHQLTLTTRHPASQRLELENQRQHARAAEQYAALLGGSFVEESTGPESHRVTASLPQLDEQGWAAEAPNGGEPPVAMSPVSDDHADSGAHARLSDADRAATAQASYQGLMELDSELRVTFVNESYAESFGRPADQFVGRPFAGLFHPVDYERLRPHVEQVLRGIPVRFEWRRRNNAGEPRWTQVAGSPRVDAEGRFDGALMMTIDTTSLHLAEDLRDAVQLDLDRARRAARRRTAQRLDDGPIQKLEGVNDRLIKLAGNTEPNDVIHVIQDELQRSVIALQSSVDRLADPDLRGALWSNALRTTLAARFLADEVELVIDDRTEGPLTGEKAEVLLKIARQAVTNAVHHGRARRVDVLLEDVGDSYRMRVIDDGIGTDPASLSTPGQLGTRSMIDRAAEQHGTFAVEPRPSGGTVVTVSIPRAAITIVAT